MLDIDTAIKHCLEVAENCEEQAKQCDSDDRYERHVMHENAKCAAEHRQLAEWLSELKDLREQKAEYKRLLKAAVEDNTRVLRENFGDICQFCKHYSNSEAQCCKPHNGSGSWCCENAEWRYADEALALIGKDIDVPATEDDTNVGHKKED